MIRSLLPPTPRPLTSRVRRRAWSEPHVRISWLIAAALLLISLAFIFSGWRTQRRQMRLIRDSVLIDAEIFQAGDERVRNKTQSAESIVVLRFDWNGTQHETRGRPLEGRREPVVIGSKVRIHVDRNDPDTWTTLDVPQELGQLILSGLIVLPIAAVAFLWTAWKYIGVLRLWREGQAIEALILDSHITALAPLSRAVRCTPADEQDKRVFSVIIPSAREPQPGEEVVILSRGAGAGRAIAVEWLEGSGFRVQGSDGEGTEGRSDKG
ncbi:MAG TPA: hypothetical protein VH370_27500, partial [Humisphaera sp.]|nr:hypothetical protein [Humisphaera sp.]